LAAGHCRWAGGDAGAGGWRVSEENGKVWTGHEAVERAEAEEGSFKHL